MLKVESKIAPFIADVASSAGATKLVKPTGWPRATVPTSSPMPTPIDSR